jgi:hypothetical protein
MERELSEVELRQIDHVNNVAYNAMCDLVCYNDLPWNIEWIGELSDAMVNIADKYLDIPKEELYPTIERN